MARGNVFGLGTLDLNAICGRQWSGELGDFGGFVGLGRTTGIVGAATAFGVGNSQ